MKKLADTIKLMAKTGLFFAHVDGDYSDKEKQFITDFILGIENVGELEHELKAQVLDTVNHAYKLDESVGETKALLEGFNPDEREAIRKSLEAFVQRVIAVDGRNGKAEQESFLKWKELVCA